MLKLPALSFVSTFLLFSLLFFNSNADAKSPPDSIKSLKAAIPALDSLDEKVIYVDFWASWCAPCRKSFPFMKELESRYQSKGLKVVAISVDKDHKAANAFVKEMAAPFEFVFDSTGTIAELYGLEAMPTSYIYGRDGKLRYSHRGFRPNDIAVLDSVVSKLLSEGSNK